MGCTWNSRKALRKMVTGMRIASERCHTRLESSTLESGVEPHAFSCKMSLSGAWILTQDEPEGKIGMLGIDHRRYPPRSGIGRFWNRRLRPSGLGADFVLTYFAQDAARLLG